MAGGHQTAAGNPDSRQMLVCRYALLTKMIGEGGFLCHSLYLGKIS